MSPRLQTSQPRQSLGAKVWPSRGQPSPSLAGDMRKPCAVRVPGADGSGACFLPNQGPLASAQGGQIQDSVRIRDPLPGPAPEAAQRPGLRLRLLPRRLALAVPPAGSGLQRQPLQERDTRRVYGGARMRGRTSSRIARTRSERNPARSWAQEAGPAAPPRASPPSAHAGAGPGPRSRPPLGLPGAHGPAAGYALQPGPLQGGSRAVTHLMFGAFQRKVLFNEYTTYEHRSSGTN